MKFRRIASTSEGAENPFWITYSDLLSSLLLVFLVLLFTFQALSQIQNKQLLKQAEELKKQANALKQKMAETAVVNLQNKQLRDRLDRDKGKLAKLKIELKILQKIAGSENIEIDDKTGEVIIKTDKSWFDKGKSVLLKSPRQFLQKHIPRWATIVTKPIFRTIIKEVVIEGHADSVGEPKWEQNYQSNMKLTQERALAVNSYIFSSEFNMGDPKIKERLRRMTSVSGRSNIDMVNVELPDPEKAPGPELLSREDPRFRTVKLRLIFNNPLLEEDKPQ